jgi:hypothetical protein
MSERNAFEEILKNAGKRREDRLDELFEGLLGVGAKPKKDHFHPPSVEPCDCTNRNIFRVPLPDA